MAELIKESGRLLREKMERPFDEVKKDVLDFFRVRFQNFLLDKGYPYDVIEAVIFTSFDELLDVQQRIDALREARTWQDFESIVIGFKRAMNILKGLTSRREINPSFFFEPIEKNLYQAFINAKERVNDHLNKRNYKSALIEMSQMRRPIDEFFDRVMVMVEDETIRDNRLALLDGIGQLFLRFADFSKLT